jgi:hypothetical protein
LAVSAITERLSAKSNAVLLQLQTRLDRILLGWLFLAALACAARIALTPLQTIGVDVVLPYFLLVLAPAMSVVLALRWFRDGDSLPQPGTRLATVGRWQSIDRAEAQRHRLYGANGIMVSLLVGMLLNVPVRAAEYLAAMPALSGSVPPWLSTLHLLMTIDVVIFPSLYAIAFVAALRRVPLFPRLLAAIWLGDIGMQLLTADLVAAAAGLPSTVAGALHALLDGNVKKVLISVALWLPYLLLSERVNVTYRHRIPA